MALVAQVVVHTEGASMEMQGDVLCIKRAGATWGNRDGKDLQLVEMKWPPVPFATRLETFLTDQLDALEAAGDIDPKLVWPFGDVYEDEVIEDDAGFDTGQKQTWMIDPSVFKISFASISPALMARILDREDDVGILSAPQLGVSVIPRSVDRRPQQVRGTLAGREHAGPRNLPNNEKAKVRRNYERAGFVE